MDSRTIASARARTPMIAALFVGLAALPSTASAEGEEVAGHPNYEERALLQLTNRARVDPQYEMEQCGMNCAEAACYDVRPPLYHKHEASRAARFHAAHMTKNGYFAHTSKCTLVPDISDLYPDSCDGAAACSCVGGTATCNPSCTSPQGRVGSFGAPYFGEIIAGGSSANQAFYLWLYKPTMDPSCMFTGENGHRWLLLTAGGAVGFGADGYYVGDFSGGGGGTKLASGSHWPRQSATVEAWTSWYDDAAPSKALVNVDGSCSPMSLGRGSAENGAYTASVSGVGQGCHRYFFVFEDSMGEPVYFPTTGSLGIGPAQGCEDWTPERPALGPGCDCAANCNGMQCGDDGCGGQCGSCGAGEVCSGGLCECLPACDGLQCGDDGCGGQCGSCGVEQTCLDGQCVDQGVTTGEPTTDPSDPSDPTLTSDPSGGTEGTSDGESSTGGTAGCVPACDGLQCGHDGCGGQCGACSPDEFCNGGQCVPGEGPDGGTALPPDYGGDQDSGDAGCGCDVRAPTPAGSLLGLVVLLGARRRRRRVRLSS